MGHQGREAGPHEAARAGRFRVGRTGLRRDKDNISSAKKYILDALVVSGVIGNDNWRWIAGNLPDTYKVNKQEPRVIVTIEGEPR